jgi:histone H3/H4
MIADQLKLLKKQRNAFEQERERLVAEQASHQATEYFLSALPEYCRRVAENIDDFTYEDKRQTLQVLQIKLVILTDRIHIDGALPGIIRQPGGDICVGASSNFGGPSGT